MALGFCSKFRTVRTRNYKIYCHMAQQNTLSYGTTKYTVIWHNKIHRHMAQQNTLILRQLDQGRKTAGTNREGLKDTHEVLVPCTCSSLQLCLPVCLFVSAPYIKPCARSDPKFNECALEHAKETFPQFVKGECRTAQP